MHAATGGFPLYVVEAARAPVGRETGPRPGTGSARAAAAGSAQTSAAGAGDRRPGRRVRPRLHARPAHRGQRPGRRGRRRGPSTSCGAADPARAPGRRLRLLPRPAPRRRLRRRSARRGAGCCTGGRPGRWSCCTPTTPDAVRGAARRAVRPRRPARAGPGLLPRGPPTWRRRVFAHAEAIRLHHTALAIVRAQPRRAATATGASWTSCRRWRRRSTPGTATPRPSCRRSWSGPSTLAETLGRTDSLVDALVGLWSSRFVQGDTAPAHAIAARALALAERRAPSSAAQAHFAFAGSALILGRPAEASAALRPGRGARARASLGRVGTRPDVHAPGLGGARALAPGRRRRGAAASAARGHRAVPVARPPVQPRGGAGLRRASPTSCAATGRAGGTRSPSCASCATRYGFGYYREWGLMLDGWCRGGEQGVDLARRGSRTWSPTAALARMPYWLVAAGRPARPAGEPRRGPRDAGRRRRDARAAGRPCGGCPRSCGCAPRTTGAALRPVPAARGGRLAAEPGQPGAAAALRARPRRARRSPGAETFAPPLRGPPTERCANAASLVSGRPIAPHAGDPDDHDPAVAPLDELAAALRGELITPADPRYDEARAVYNGMIDKRPGGDRPLPRRRRRAGLRPVRPRVRRRPSPSAAAATTPAGSASGTTRWSSTCRACAAPPSTRERRTVRVDGGCTLGRRRPRHRRVRHGRPRRASSPPPASAGSPSAAGSATCPGASA